MQLTLTRCFIFRSAWSVMKVLHAVSNTLLRSFMLSKVYLYTTFSDLIMSFIIKFCSFLLLDLYRCLQVSTLLLMLLITGVLCANRWIKLPSSSVLLLFFKQVYSTTTLYPCSKLRMFQLLNQNLFIQYVYNYVYMCTFIHT